jgi:hypothetical protein
MIIQKKLKWKCKYALNSSLIRGAQSLFGVKPNCNLEKQRLQVFSEQKSEQKV